MSILANARFNANGVLAFAIDRACLALRRELEKYGYNAAIISEILPFARDEGSLAGAVELGMIDPEDVGHMTEVFVRGFGDVHQSHPSWNDSGIWMTTPHPTEAESRAYAELSGSFDAEGSPALEPEFEPLVEDRWLEYSFWAALSDPSQPPDVLECEWAEVGARSR